jgi:Xaa-Pro aminopeptidase
LPRLSRKIEHQLRNIFLDSGASMKLNQVSVWRGVYVKLFLLSLLSVALCAANYSVQAKAGDKDYTINTSAIRATPPAPVFDEKERLGELAARRARVAEQIGNKSLLVMFIGQARNYTGDVDYKFRSENNFYYLTNLQQQGAFLVLLPGNDGAREILFIRRRNPAIETWTGKMYSPEEARAISGISEIWEAREFPRFIAALHARETNYHPAKESVLLSSNANGASINFQQLFGAATSGAGKQSAASLYMILPARVLEEDELREYPLEQKFAKEWTKQNDALALKDVRPIFAAMRLRKSPMEIKQIQHAIDISIEAHERGQAMANQAQWEYEVEAEVDYTYKRRNADNWGYPSIVGCGDNATTLHYEESQGRVTPGQLMLMDVGAEYNHYSADVTRTFPVNGKFTREQAEIYQIVLDAQEAGMHAVRPGATIADVNQAATKVIKDGLLRLGLITDANSQQYRYWFMHGTSHWLGMNVHDVGASNAKFEPGMIFTVEPGIYIRPDALDYLPNTPEAQAFAKAVRPAFEKYKGIGVRIEDDVLVTPEGYRNLSGALPRTIKDVEDFLARARAN